MTKAWFSTFLLKSTFTFSLLSSVIKAQAPDLTACNGRTICVPSTLTVGSNTQYIAWAFNYFSEPLVISMYSGNSPAQAQSNCKTLSNPIIQQWTLTSLTLDPLSKLGYYYLNLNQIPDPQTSQRVFFSFFSNPTGNCIISDNPITVIQNSLLVSPGLSPSQPSLSPLNPSILSSNGITNSSSSGTNTPNNTEQYSNQSSTNTIILASCIATGLFLFLLLFFVILILRKRRKQQSKIETIEDPLVVKNESPINQVSLATSESEIGRKTDNARLLKQSNAQLIAETFRKELSDPLMNRGWDACSAGSIIDRTVSQKSGESAVSPL